MSMCDVSYRARTGVTMGCGFWNSTALHGRRLLRDNKKAQGTAHKYYALYGCYPSRAG